MKNIAVVDRCKNNEKAGHFVTKYLIEHGYNVIPINPTITEVLGRSSYSILCRYTIEDRYCQHIPEIAGRPRRNR